MSLGCEGEVTKPQCRRQAAAGTWEGSLPACLAEALWQQVFVVLFPQKLNTYKPFPCV